jgi:hypothetical protein
VSFGLPVLNEGEGGCEGFFHPHPPAMEQDMLIALVVNDGILAASFSSVEFLIIFSFEKDV